MCKDTSEKKSKKGKKKQLTPEDVTEWT